MALLGSGTQSGTSPTSGCVSASSHSGSRHLMSLGPQPPHKTVNACRFRWSEYFDRIFRKEGAAGSIPPAPLNALVRGDVGKFERLSLARPSSLAPHMPHKRLPLNHPGFHAVSCAISREVHSLDRALAEWVERRTAAKEKTIRLYARNGTTSRSAREAPS